VAQAIRTNAQSLTVGSLFTGFIGGIVAWIITTVLGEPIRHFFELRQQAASVLAKYDDLPWIGNPDAKPPGEAWLKERREAYDRVGSELVAFADSNTFIARTLHNRLLGRYRCYVRNSGNTLRTLGEAFPGTKAWDTLRRSAMSGLKIAGWPRDVR
jgi:hypothetical protein